VTWVFQFGTGLTTAVNSTVKLINPGSNGGSDDGIFWNAATGAIVIGDNNTVLGNYIAYTSVTFTGSTQLLGNGGARFLALNAAVTFAGPGTVNALGGAGGGDWTGGVLLNGSSVVTVPTVPIIPAGAPVITSPTIASGIAGAPFAYSIAATGLPTSFSATGLPPGLTINAQTGAISGTATAAGTYVTTIQAANSSGTSTSTVTITIAPVPSSRIVNFSARALSGPGSQALIMGFVVSGDNKNLLMRGVGPTLASYGIVNFLADPMLTLFAANGTVSTNDDWGTNSSGQAQGPLVAATAAGVGAFALPAGSKDSALLVTVNNGAHTTGLVRPNSTTGVALIEIYDTDGNSNPGSRLVNVSARMNVTSGEGVLIAGLMIAGNAPKTVLIRGIGPALAAFGVTGVLADPVITVYSGSTQIASDDDWETGTSTALKIATTAQQVGAFALPSGGKDSALLITLQPGNYTVQVNGVGNTSGVALIEIYDVQ
jgi:hypothetical protein